MFLRNPLRENEREREGAGERERESGKDDHVQVLYPLLDRWPDGFAECDAHNEWCICMIDDNSRVS